MFLNQFAGQLNVKQFVKTAITLSAGIASRKLIKRTAGTPSFAPR